MKRKLCVFEENSCAINFQFLSTHSQTCVMGIEANKKMITPKCQNFQQTQQHDQRRKNSITLHLNPLSLLSVCRFIKCRRYFNNCNCQEIVSLQFFFVFFTIL